MNNKLNSNEIIRLLSNLIGEVTAAGDSCIDGSRLYNLKTMIEVTDWCLAEISYASYDSKRSEASMKEIGDVAVRALREWKSWLGEHNEI